AATGARDGGAPILAAGMTRQVAGGFDRALSRRERSMKKLLRTVVLLGVVALAAAAVWQWRQSSQKNALPAGIVAGNGRVESAEVDIAAKYGGRIKEILVREGDLVQEDQVLVKMDTDELEAELAKDKANLAQTEETAAEVRTDIAKSASQLKLAEV